MESRQGDGFQRNVSLWRRQFRDTRWDAPLPRGEKKTEGSIEVGKLADVIIVSQDLFKIAPNQIGKTKVLMTMVGGKAVYQDSAWEDK